jgi:hypothetical protein
MYLKSRGFTNKSLVFVLLSGALIGSAALTYQSSVPSPADVKAPVAGKAKSPLAKPVNIKPVVLRRSEPLKVVPIDLAPKGNSADKRGSP